jgi:predicted phosphate transport protein (TIGR00153 family)
MPNNSIFGVFAKSPIRPLLKHMNKVAECSAQLLPFLEQCAKANWVKAEKIRKNISVLEKEADVLKRELRLTLPKGLFMPVDRNDLIELVRRQDRIANITKDIAGIMYGRQLQIPKEISEKFMVYAKRSIDAVNQAKKAINELDELLETGFRGREVKIVTDMIEVLDLIEDDTDRLQIRLRRHLLAIEQNYSPVDIMFLYQITEWVGQLADNAETLGCQLELMLIRS